MKTISITGSARESLGSKEAKQARNNDLVPCVMYGSDKQIHFTVDSTAFNKIVYTPEVFNVLITIDGTEYSTILKAVQFHPTTDKTVHADFLLLEKGKKVTVKMPVNLTGSSKGVKNGGRLQTPLKKVKIKGALENIPDNVEVDITDLRIGQTIKVASLSVPGLEFLDPATNVIAAVKRSRGSVDDEEEEDAEGAEGAEATAEGAEAAEA